jgi:hypothetical protein
VSTIDIASASASASASANTIEVAIGSVSSTSTNVAVGVSRIGDVIASRIASMSTTAIVRGTVVVVCVRTIVIASMIVSKSTMTIASCTVSGSVSNGVDASMNEIADTI